MQEELVRDHGHIDKKLHKEIDEFADLIKELRKGPINKYERKTPGILKMPKPLVIPGTPPVTPSVSSQPQPPVPKGTDQTQADESMPSRHIRFTPSTKPEF